MARALHKAGKIQDLCEAEDVFTRLTSLERQYPSASVLVHKQGVLPPEIAALWACPALMSAAHQLLGGAAPYDFCFCCMHAWFQSAGVSLCTGDSSPGVSAPQGHLNLISLACDSP